MSHGRKRLATLVVALCALFGAPGVALAATSTGAQVAAAEVKTPASPLVPPGTYKSLSPSRLLDTRANVGANGPVAALGTVHLPVLGKGGVPATGVAAVVLNVTVNAPAQPGNITVYPDATTMPLASNLNFVPGQTIPNLVVTKVGANGNVALTNNSPGTVQLIADVAGYYLSGTPTAPGTYVPLNPARVLDTRTNLGATGPVAASGTVHLPVLGKGGVPATGVAAVVLNVTVNAPAQPGNITVYPDATTMPLASNLNFVPGQTIPNLVVAKIGANGNIALTNNSPGTVQLIADVAGYYLSGTPTAPGTYVPLNPARVLDTRTNLGATGPVAALNTVHLPVVGMGGVPATGVAAVVLNVTVNAPAQPGNITVYPDATTMPLASNLNFVPGQTIPNLVVAKIGANGNVALTNNSPGTVQLIADVAGYYLSGPTPSISTASLPPGTIDTAYSTTLQATGGIAPYTWSLFDSSLPAGLSLDSNTGAITGTPTAGATNPTLTVQVTEADGTASLATLSLNISTTASAIDAGGAHSCAVTTGGAVQCWGDNEDGALGDGTHTDSSTPVQVSGLTSGVKVVATGDFHTCALTTSGGVKCWGYNEYGSLGNGTTTDSTTPVQVSGLTSGVQAIAAGGIQTCALTTGGSVKCWGYNEDGELGNGSFTDTSTPVQVSGLTSGVQAITMGEVHTCALSTGGAVQCWGFGEDGELGNGSTATSNTPVQVTGLTSGVQGIAAGGGQTCAVTTGGSVQCWGFNEDGELGNDSTTSSSTPVQVSGLTSGIQSVSVGAFHACGVSTGGGTKCWGANFVGQLGNGSTTTSTTPVQVNGLTAGIQSVAAGFAHTCALTTSGAVQCWGANDIGQLGTGTHTNATAPVTALGY